MDDNRIIELYFARDERAIQETSAKYGKLCLHTARNLLSIEADAEECVNDTYMVTWNQIPPTRPQYYAAYLCKIVRNLALKKLEYIHAKKRTPDAVIPFEELESVLSDAAIEQKMEAEDLGRMISEFLRTEKKDARIIFLRRYFFGDSIRTIAERFHMQENTVKSMLFRTRGRLRTYLKKEDVSV